MPELLVDSTDEAGTMLPRLHVVRRTCRETADTVTLELGPLDDDVVRCAPGQFTMLGVPGRGEVPISASGDPRGEALVHTVRRVGAATAALCEARSGDVVTVRGPFGRGWPVEAARQADVLCVAGGIGLAPVRPIVLEQLAGRLDAARCQLLLGCRTPVDMPFGADLDGWRRSGIDVLLTVDQPVSEWSGRVGLVTKLLPEAAIEPARTVAFVCGPEIMMRRTADALVAMGVGADRVHVSLERNMRCGFGHCGHCQLGRLFVCVDGPVIEWSVASRLLEVRDR